MKDNYSNSNHFSLNYKSTVYKAIKKLNANGQAFLAITKKGKLFGSLTDSDLRRKILLGLSKDSPVYKVCHKKPKFVFSKDKNLYGKLKNIFNKYETINIVPVLNKKKKIQSYASRSNFGKQNVHNDFSSIIIAGGKGKRLLPITKTLPKPLIKFEGKPYLINLIKKLLFFKTKSIHISLFYKSKKFYKIIKKNFEKSVKNKTINFVKESKPLGTAGSMSLVKNVKSKNVLVLNADIIFNLNLNSLINFHNQNKNFLTIVIKDYQVHVPFGVVRFEKNKFNKIIEKPNYNLFTNTGIYLFDRKIFNFMKDIRKIDMPQLIDKLVSGKKKIGVFPINEEFIDFGSHKNLLEAKKRFDKYHSM